MKQFFKFLFASCLGTVLGIFALFFFGIWTANKFANKLEATETVSPNSILTINLSDQIPERTNNVPVNTMNFDITSEGVIGLQDLVEALEVAKEDDNIKGIYLELGSPQTGLATLTTLRNAVKDFKESGKFVFAYGTFYTQGSYYFASVSDELYLNPIGNINLSGFAVMIPFFKDMLDRLGVKAEVFYAGKFKSATEPFRRTEMSEENRLQVKEYLEDNFESFLKEISISRGVSIAELKRIANDMELREAEDAVRLKIADGLKYKDEVLNEIKSKLGLDKKDKISAISLSSYHKSKGPKPNFKSKNKIAVVYAEGSIIDGEGEPGSIGGDYYSRMIRKIRQDDNVKAIVLRVNSGGGSVWASEHIWREMAEANRQGIRTVTSMGDVAASGGYYIACNSDQIFAEPTTITGSIGVFGVIPNFKKFMDEKIGITFDSVKTTEHAVAGSPFFDLAPSERSIIQETIDTIYQSFLSRVAEGRDMPISAVDKIAQGRVWTGEKALEIGLIDKLGDLNDAISKAAELAELDSYRMVEYPKTKEPLQQIIEEFTGKDSNFGESMIKNELGEPLYTYYKYAKEIKGMSGYQARIPFDLKIR